jgi:heptosyltransferase I
MRIAIVKLSALGDIVHAMVVLQFIKKYNHECLIDWFVEESYKELLELHPDLNKVHIVKLKNVKKRKSLSRLFAELMRVRKLESYDIVIDLQGLIKSALISNFIPSKKTIGFNKDSIREKLAAIFYSDKFNIPYSQNIIERNLKLVGFTLGFSVSKKEIQLKVPFIFSAQKHLDFKLSNTRPNILLVPGASNISKCYPFKKFAELSKLFDANFVVIWGNENEKLLAQKIKELSPRVNILSKLSIDSLVTLVSTLDLVIGPDTGPTHIAWALNIPSITLFGPTPGYRNTYVTSINRIIESDSIVNPMQINKNDFSIQNIDANEIILIVKDLVR